MKIGSVSNQKVSSPLLVEVLIKKNDSRYLTHKYKVKLCEILLIPTKKLFSERLNVWFI